MRDETEYSESFKCKIPPNDFSQPIPLAAAETKIVFTVDDEVKGFVVIYKRQPLQHADEPPTTSSVSLAVDEDLPHRGSHRRRIKTPETPASLKQRDRRLLTDPFARHSFRRAKTLSDLQIAPTIRSSPLPTGGGGVLHTPRPGQEESSFHKLGAFIQSSFHKLQRSHSSESVQSDFTEDELLSGGAAEPEPESYSEKELREHEEYSARSCPPPSTHP